MSDARGFTDNPEITEELETTESKQSDHDDRVERRYTLYLLPNPESKSMAEKLLIAVQGDAVLLFPASDSLDECKYTARIIQGGQYLQHANGSEVQVPLVSEDSLSGTGLLTPAGTPHYYQLINTALIHANVAVPENIK